MTIKRRQLENVAASLSDAVTDPGRWTAILDEISNAVGATGAMLLPYAGSQGVMASPSLHAALQAYVQEGWHEEDRDPRKRAVELAMRGQVATDDDLLTSDEMRHSPMYNELLSRFDLKWWAGIGFFSGQDPWCLALHRSPRKGQFDRSEKAILQQLVPRLNEIGQLCHVISYRAILGVADAFDRVQQAAIAVDKTGKVIRVNQLAEQLFSDSMRVREGRLTMADAVAANELNKHIDRLRFNREGKSLGAQPIIVKRKGARPLLIKILPLDGATKAPFLNARALLLLNEIRQPKEPDCQVLIRAFDLTQAEARVAARLATGQSVSEISEAHQISKATARNHLKAIFHKMSVSRQSELVALLTAFASF